MKPNTSQLTILFTIFMTIAGCQNSSTKPPQNTLLVATTTSTRDSGLMDILVPIFENTHSIKIKLIAVGTGKALQLGRQGDVDLLLVHSPEDELQFMADNHGIRHEPLMHNYFEILGPKSDPAHISGKDPVEALRLIRQSGATFVSRGDESGTHQREKALWNQLEKQTKWSHYLETGQGIGNSLVIANEKQAYCLCDQGTFLAMQHRIELIPLAKRTPDLRNSYSILCVNPNKSEKINSTSANRFTEFLISQTGQSLIADFKIDEKTLFHTLRTAIKAPHN
ncbi:MAG: substrate-binding domain-containing protein [Planctomycetota bacterium]|nr:substrate-binding domain-containing protein [Planctomycetota bacterium]